MIKSTIPLLHLEESSRVFLPAITLARESPVLLYKQLYEAIRLKIFRATLRRGLRLHLAAELRIAGNIVGIAFEQLLAEGYLQARTGAGTFVTNTLPEEILQVLPGYAGFSPDAIRKGMQVLGTVIRKYVRAENGMAKR